MQNWQISLAVITFFILIIFYKSQTRFRDKMLCQFTRPNLQKIEKWVPLYSTHVIFDRGKYGIGHYECDPGCITMLWFTRGINKFFPTLVPTLEFRWWSEYPVNPKTNQITWRTPEAVNAAWQTHQHEAYAKAAQVQSGAKKKFPEWLFPIIIAALVVVAIYISYQGIAALDQRMFEMEQFMKLKIK